MSYLSVGHYDVLSPCWRLVWAFWAGSDDKPTPRHQQQHRRQAQPRFWAALSLLPLGISKPLLFPSSAILFCSFLEFALFFSSPPFRFPPFRCPFLHLFFFSSLPCLLHHRLPPLPSPTRPRAFDPFAPPSAPSQVHDGYVFALLPRPVPLRLPPTSRPPLPRQ